MNESGTSACRRPSRPGHSPPPAPSASRNGPRSAPRSGDSLPGPSAQQEQERMKVRCVVQKGIHIKLALISAVVAEIETKVENRHPHQRQAPNSVQPRVPHSRPFIHGDSIGVVLPFPGPAGASIDVPALFRPCPSPATKLNCSHRPRLPTSASKPSTTVQTLSTLVGVFRCPHQCEQRGGRHCPPGRPCAPLQRAHFHHAQHHLARRRLEPARKLIWQLYDAGSMP